MAAGITGGLEYGQGAVGKFGEESTGIVNGDFLLFSGLGVHAFLNEGFGHGTYFHNRTVQPNGGVDAMSKQVASHPTAGNFGIQSPQTFSSLG